MRNNIHKYALAILPHVVILLGIILIVLLTLGNKHRSLTTATYTRFEVCTLNVPAAYRSQADIDRCWKLAEKSTGMSVDHFNK